jgi:hypothetical protein
MNRPDFLSKIIGILFVIVFLAGCAAPTTTPSLPPTSAPPLRTNPALPSPPTPAQPIQPTGQTILFRFVRTVQVTPDSQYLGGAFARIEYLPANDNFVVTFGGPLAQPPASCGEKGFSYKEYTLDMQETGESGTFSCDPFDAGSLMVNNTYYFAAMAKRGDQDGWHLLKIDATDWSILVDEFFPLTGSPQAQSNDPMVAFANGQIDISSQYNDNPTGAPPRFMIDGAATHHHFFSTDLELLDEKILADSPNIVGSSLIYVDGIYNFVTANAFLGDVVVMQYDQDWNYLGVKTLLPQAHWSTGLVYDGQKFYLAYMDTSQRINPDNLPVYLNVHLAAFDRDWNLLEDIAVTDYAISDNRQPGRPWVILHDNHLYVSYDVDTIDPTTQQEQLEWQAYVSVYELTGQPGGQPNLQPTQSTGQVGACPQSDTSILGVLRSSDHAATWTSLGNACMPNSTIGAVDPTGFALDGQVVLYLVDIKNLQNPTSQTIYRATSADGVNFDTPQPAYTQAGMMVDPVVLPMPDGTFRLYVPSADEGIISAVSHDGITFTREQGVRIIYGGMPGALTLPDNHLRMFLNNGPGGQPGIISMISEDGLNFTLEDGMRLQPSPGYVVNNPQPIQMNDGGYLMLYQIHEASLTDHPDPWTFTENHLATSVDGLNWILDPKVIVYGGTSCLVQMPDGTLYIYYVNGNP